MSKALPMYSLDKVRMSMLVQTELTIKLRNRAKEKGVTAPAYLNAMMAAAFHDDPWTEADERLRQKIYNENKKKRNLRMAKHNATKEAK